MFTKRFRICSVLGFPIYLDLSWFAIAILISWSLATGVFPQQVEGLSPLTYWTMGVAGAIGLFVSIHLQWKFDWLRNDSGRAKGFLGTSGR